MAAIDISTACAMVTILVKAYQKYKLYMVVPMRDHMCLQRLRKAEILPFLEG